MLRGSLAHEVFERLFPPGKDHPSEELIEEKANTVDIKHFISLIRKCKEPTEISDLMFAELIDKIVVLGEAALGDVAPYRL